jgi:hypothetical protein
MKKILLLIGLIALLALLTGCGGQEQPPQVVKETVVVVETVEVEVVVTKEVEVMVEATPEFAVEIPFAEYWAGSGHANAEAEAFRHWDEEDPAEVPTNCAKCHSTPGMQDFLGADGSAAGTVDAAAALGSTVECVACHNDVTLVKNSVVFPSGVEVTGLGNEAICMECHQGRASKVSVDGAIEEAGLTDMDTVSEDLGFTNIHYFAAAATQAGGTAMGGYQYDGKVYDAKFAHVEEFDNCVGCHNSHTLELKVEECQACHTGVTSAEDMRNVRMAGSLVDYDGDGDMDEGIYYEIEGLRDVLYQAMQAYSSDVSGTPIAYNAASYPYFFIDTNANGEADEDESVSENGYNAWTGRLAKAAYNYQTSLKDPGAYAHGGKYIIQLLYDSIEDLNADLVADLRRIDHGHFAGSEEAFRHWDEDGEVPANCTKCHSAEGLPLFAKDGVSITQDPANGFLCATCHASLTEEGAPRYEFAEVEFPSGLVVTAEEADANTLLCMNCHQGRESTVSVNRAIGDSPDDEVAEGLGFRNVHYFAAGATRYGTQAKGIYEYDGQDYSGYFEHVGAADSCTDCHSAHTLQVQVDKCAECHEGVESKEDLASIRISEVDYDGDGDVAEGVSGEVGTMHEALYAAIQAYAADTIGTEIVYNPSAYPYWFTAAEERYATWTPRLLRAAYNYQYAAKDPGAFAHNAPYVIQALYDSIEDVGGDVSGMTRPEVSSE